MKRSPAAHRGPVAPLGHLRRRVARTLRAAAAVLAVAGLGAAPAPPPAPDDAALGPADRLPALLARVRWENERIRTLEADFRQHKESALLLAPEEARGTFSYAAPDRVRWEYLAPNPISLLIAGDEMTTWYRDMGQAEKMSVGRHSQRLLKYLGASSSLASLLEYFDVRLHLPEATREPYRLELEPRFARIARRLAGMTLWLDRQSFLPVRLRYVEADGDLTDYRFENFRVNPALPLDRFRLTLPTGVQVKVLAFDSAAGGS